MPAQATPKGTVPEKTDAAPVTDVKETIESESSPEKQDPKAAAQSAEIELDEQDLKDLENKQVPYSRFKEKNEETKRLKEQLELANGRRQEEIRKAEELAEARAEARFKRDTEDTSFLSTLDPSERKIKSMENDIVSMREELKRVQTATSERFLQEEVDRLEKKYSKTIVTAALGLKRSNPRVSLSEACEEFDHDVDARASKKLTELIESKKARAKASLPGREGGIKLTEKPKTLKEASEAVKRLSGFLNRR